MNDWKHKKLVVFGLGRSGMSAIKLAFKLDAIIFAINTGNPEKWKNFDEIQDFVTKENCLSESNSKAVELLKDADCVILSPGVPRNHTLISKSEIEGIVPIVSEIEFAYQVLNIPVYAITGTNGKTTTVSLLGKMLETQYEKLFIGGGVGHLSRILSKYFKLSITCVDNNSEFLNYGKSYLKKQYPPNKDLDVHFLHHHIGTKENKTNILSKLHQSNTFCIGLHTCGALANEQLKSATKFPNEGLLNFGCCYFKLNSRLDLNISQFARENGLELSTHALTLATRSHTGFKLKDFMMKKRVKSYRYSLHLLLYYELGIKHFVEVGESPTKFYLQSFEEYANKKLEYLNLKNKITDKLITSFFKDEKVQKTVERMILSNIIRWQFGRAIEHYILTDRCLFLEENGKKPEMFEFFISGISPRNIGILI